MTDDRNLSDINAAVKAEADAADAARAEADRVKDAAGTADAITKTAPSVTDANPLNVAGKSAADAATADAAAAKAAADAVTNDSATKTAAKATAAAKAKAEAATGLNGDVPATVQTRFFNLVQTVVNDPIMSSQDKEKLLAKLGGMNPVNDIATFRWAIWLLGALAILSIISLFTLAVLGHGKDVPDGLVALGSGAAGALAGLLNGNKSSDTPH